MATPQIWTATGSSPKAATVQHESERGSHAAARRQAKAWAREGKAVTLCRYIDNKRVKEITPRFPELQRRS